MFAAGDSDAVSFCVLSHAECGDGFAACAVDVGARSFSARSVAYLAGRNYCDDADHAAHDAAGGDGSSAAEDDECDDAGNAGDYELEFAGGAGTVLVRGTADWNRAAIGHESHVTGARDAGDDGEAGAEEGEIAVSSQLSAVSKGKL